MGKDKLQITSPTSESRMDLASDDEERGNWGNQCDFFLSCLGYAVGLGNVWRFPYLCFDNGGGAFLIPYVIFLLCAGVPLFFMELSLGQYASLGPNIVFRKIAPLFHGVGYTMLVITFLVVIYYNMIIAWTIFYTCASFTSELAWTYCGADWTSKDCFTIEQQRNCTKVSNETVYWNKTCTTIEDYCTSNKNPCREDFKDCTKNIMEYYNVSHCTNVTARDVGDLYLHIPLKNVTRRISPSEEYFSNYMLAQTDGWHDFGEMRWQLALCLLLAWIIVCLCLIRGVKSSGKVVYFTALFPYVVLVIFFIKGLTLDGAYDGIKFYITPDWGRLSNSKVWGQAATQIFYSLGSSFGCLITMASYNKFKNNCERDAIVVAFSNCCTSVFAGFVIFSIVGSLAYDLGVEVKDVIKSGPGLAFIAYPDALLRLPIPPVWSILFFVMLITLGLDSQFAMVEALTSATMDKLPGLRKKKHLVVIGTCVVGFLLGLPLCMEGGIYLFSLIDGYSAGWSLLMCGAIELIVVSIIYGHHKIHEVAANIKGPRWKAYWHAFWNNSAFSDNIEEMLGHRPFIYWRVTWQIVTPLLMIAILIFTWVQYTPASYGDYVFPDWANALGWIMAFSSVIMIPIFAIYEWLLSKKTGEALLKPTSDWAPAHVLAAKVPPASYGSSQMGFDNPGFKASTKNGDIESFM